MNKDKNQKDNNRKVIFNTTLGVNLALGTLLLTYLGHWIDQKQGGGPFWVFWGVTLGFIYAGYEIWKSYRSLNDRE